jgi:aspartate racemase
VTSGRPTRRVVGVLGGMGPLATADFYTKLIRLTPARTDQEHLHVIIDSTPEVPDRTAAVLGQGPDPTPALATSARRLVQAGAEILAVPCNSAHAFLEAIREAAAVPVLDMMEEVASFILALRPPVRTAGLLATSGTLVARLYHRALLARGIAVVEPPPAGQERLMAAIYAVKAGDTGEAVRSSVREVALGLVEVGAQAVVLGCTELPLVMGPQDLPVPVLDATEILARATIREATGGEFGRSPERFHDNNAGVAARRR